MLAIHTDTSSEPYPWQSFGREPPWGHVDSTPIDPGRRFSGSYSGAAIKLVDCGTYLYWAAPSSDGSLSMSCFFSTQHAP